MHKTLRLSIAFVVLALSGAARLLADYDVEITGTTSGSVWGSGPYTNDSSLGAAAVHAGLLQPGETGLIRIHELPGQSSYSGSTAHGVTTGSWGAWGASISLELLGSTGGGGGGSNHVPSASFSAPSAVDTGTAFSASVSAHDDDGDLQAMSIRWLNHGTQEVWLVSGYDAPSQSTSITPPSSPETMYVRGEAADTHGAAGATNWQAIQVSAPPAPQHQPVAYLGWPDSMTVGKPSMFTVTAEDVDNDLNILGVERQNASGGAEMVLSWPATGGRDAAVIRSDPVLAPSTPQTLNFRAVAIDSAGNPYRSAWKTVQVFAVAPSTIAVAPSSLAIDQLLTVSYGNAPAGALVRLCAQGSAQSAYVLSVGSISTAGNGSIPISISNVFTIGSAYEARLFEANGTTLLATSNPFSVTQQAPPATYRDVDVVGTTSGSAWGTDTYTANSNLGVVAVHMGLLAPGQSGRMRIYDLPGLTSYVASTRYGVTTYPYSLYGASIRMEALSTAAASNPGVDILLPSPPQVCVGDTFLIAGDAADGDGDLRRSVLVWNNTTMIDRSYQAKTYYDDLSCYVNAGSAPGSKTIKVWANDSRNPSGAPASTGYASTEVSVSVIPQNTAPRAINLTVTTSTATNVVFSAHATDSDGNLARLDIYVSFPPLYNGYELKVSLPVSGGDVTTPITWIPTTALPGGTYHARLVARDGPMASSSETVETSFIIGGTGASLTADVSMQPTMVRPNTGSAAQNIQVLGYSSNGTLTEYQYTISHLGSTVDSAPWTPFQTQERYHSSGYYEQILVSAAYYETVWVPKMVQVLVWDRDGSGNQHFEWQDWGGYQQVYHPAVYQEGDWIDTSYYSTDPVQLTSGAFTKSITITPSTGLGAYDVAVSVKNASGQIASLPQPKSYNVTVNSIAPIAAAATNLSSTGFTANWASVAGATGYRLDVATDSAFTSFISAAWQDRDVGNVTSISVTNLPAGLSFYYRVRGVNSGVSSNSSNTIKVVGFPTARSASAVSSGTFYANWSPVVDASSYRLDVSADNFATTIGIYGDLNVGNVTTFGVNGLAGNTRYSYRVRGTDSIAAGGNSNVVTLLTAPTVAVSPQSKAVPVSGNSSFAVSVGGNGEVTYQWQRKAKGVGEFGSLVNGAEYGGVTTATLTLTGVSAQMDADQFRCVVTNTTGFVVSGIAVLNITTAPNIIRHPSPRAAAPGRTVSFLVAAVGAGPLTYQWQMKVDGGSSFADIVDGSGYTGATTMILSVGPTSEAMNGAEFRCAVGNIAGITTSNAATLTVSATASDDGGALPENWPNLAGADSHAVGMTRGELSVDKGGALNYSVPIWVSPGTAGMQPTLSLNYSSQAGEGIAGFGWSLSGASAISRGGATMLVDRKIRPITFTSDDAFYLDGQRLVAVGADTSGNVEYRTKIDSLTRVVGYGSAGSGPAYFKAWTKAGLIIEFGNTSLSAHSRVDADSPSGVSPGALVWSVSRITDTCGNYISFSYGWDESAREQVLSRIDYTGNEAQVLSTYASVVFTYEFSYASPRPDHRRMYVAGSRSESVRRLRKIESSGPDGVARTYLLKYKLQPVSNWSVLDSLTETDGPINDSTGEPMAGHSSYPPLAFTYYEHLSQDMNWESRSAFAPPVALTKEGGAGTGFADLDGDGYPDFVLGLGGIKTTWLNRVGGFVTTSKWQLPAPLSVGNGKDQGARFVDLNGDGLVDFVNGHPNSANHKSWLNTPATSTGWSETSSYALPANLIEDNGNPAGAVLLDVNGDGLPDLIVIRSDVNGVYLNTGAGWSSLNTNWALPTPSDGSALSIYLYDNDKDNGIRFVDVNGDGLPDVLQARMNRDGLWLASRAWINNGSGWTYTANFNPTVPLVRDDYAAWGVEIADINGDGLPDLVANHWNGTPPVYKYTYFNTGNGWELDTSHAFEAPFNLAIASGSSGSKLQAGSALIDLAQDGLPAQIWRRGGRDQQGVEITPQTGISFLQPAGFGGAITSGNLNLTSCFLAYDSEANIGGQFVDFDADGNPDFVWNIENATLPSGCLPSGALRNSTPRANLLKTVINGFSVSAAVYYAPLTERDASGIATVYDKGTDRPPGTINIVNSSYVVKRVENDDGLGGQYPVNYRYGGLRADVVHGGLGFAWVRATDGRSGIQTETTFSQSYPFVGMPVGVVTKLGTKTLSSVASTYDVKVVDERKPQLPYAKDVLQRAFDLDGSYISGSLTSTLIDDYGNATQVAVDSLDSSATPDGFSKTTDSKFADPDTTKWFLGQLKRSTVTATAPGKPTIVRTSSFGYESDTGLLREEVIEPKFDANDNPDADGQDTLRTTYQHDPFGNKKVAKVTGWDVDEAGTPISSTRTSTTIYDLRGRFPDHSTNAAGHEERYGYDQNLGLLTSLTGPNDLPTAWGYDGFGNRISETRSDATQTNVLIRWAGAGAPAGSKYFIETKNTGGVSTIVFNDSFGRSIQNVSIDGDGQIIYRDTVYDKIGHTTKSSMPYRTSANRFWVETKELEFDALNRPLKITSPQDNTGAIAVTTFSYSGLTTEVTDAKLRVTRTIKNSQGSVAKVIRNATAAADATDRSEISYDYDAFGNLTQTVADGTVTDLWIDTRGRKYEMKDDDMGGALHHWKYTYNAFGELVKQVDANGKTVWMSYDTLGRMKSRIEEEGTTRWTYDTAAHGKGRLASVSVIPGTYSENYTYDSQGRPFAVTRNIDGTPYTVSQLYDGSGRPETMVYPSQFQTRNVYNAFGFVKEVRRADSGLNTLYWMADRYAVDGRIDGETYGNGVTNDRVYDEASGRLSGAGVGLGGSSVVQFLQYAYDPMGNVTARVDGAIGRDERFSFDDGGGATRDGYDGLDRLRAHRVVGGSTVEVKYAPNGNITWKSDVGFYDSYGVNAGPHAVTGISAGLLGTQSYTYDNNGNMRTGGGRTISWTTFNQVLSITDQSGHSSTFSFGAAHERVKQVAHNGTTVYVGGIWEKFTDTSGAAVEKNYVLAPTGRIAVVSFGDNQSVSGQPLAGRVNYFHTDGLGSITAVTDEAGALVNRFAYDAWGKRLSVNLTTFAMAAASSTNNGNFTRGFTDHEHLDDLGLVHMNGRVYDPVLGRFLSADPFVGDAYDSQAYNRYSYVGNNPLNATDPSGFFGLKDVLPAIVGVVVAAVAIVAICQGWGAVFGGNFFGQLGLILNSGVTSGIAFSAGAAGGFASGFSGSLLNGGSIGDAFKAGVIGGAVGGVTAVAAQGIGNFFGGDDGTFAQWGERTLAHATVGGLASEAQGGEFRHGFYASAASVGFMHSSIGRGLMSNSSIAVRTATAATIGGTASALGGGKFANGAMTAAFQHLFNAEHWRKDASGIKTIEEAKAFFQRQAASGVANAQEIYDTLTNAKVTVGFGDVGGDELGKAVSVREGLGGQGALKSATITVKTGLAGVDLLATLAHEVGHVITPGPFMSPYYREYPAYLFEEQYRTGSKFPSLGSGTRTFGGKVNEKGVSDFVEKLYGRF